VTDSPELVSTAIRTLLAAGYQISGSHRQPSHIEIPCERTTRLGAPLKLLIAITDATNFRAEEVTNLQHAAQNQSRALVAVSMEGSEDQLSWDEFLEALGGAVPPWRVLNQEFTAQLSLASRNELPAGMSGEAWRVFEDLVADGLEFCLGRKVNRLGANKRGKKVSDMVAVLPDFDVIVVDAKASARGFDAVWDALRPLAEYVEKQKIRQKGGGAVTAALLCSSTFRQDPDGLSAVSRTFIAETRTPLSLITAETLDYLVREFLKTPDIRNAISWNNVFAGGLIEADLIAKEIASASSERCELRE